jgi:hypothetical protein
VVAGFYEKDIKMNRQVKRFVHGGRYAAEVKVELIPDDNAWGPYLSMEDALKLERVEDALKNGNLDAAAREASVFELLPVSA